jgi:hypothetical protein
MSFMYLKLYWRTHKEKSEIFGEGLYAKIESEGELPKRHSLGTSSSRMTHAPVAVFQLAGFEGLENIDTDELWTEIFSRCTTKELIHKLGQRMTADELVRELRSRIIEDRLEPRRDDDESDICAPLRSSGGSL